MSGRTVVLVADDDEGIRSMLVRALRDELGVRATAASSGQAALEAARLIEPADVLLDLVMPVVDGLEVARRLRAAPTTRSIPILAISGSDRRAEAVAAGCDAFLAKPLQLTDVLAWVGHRLR
jgi:CheY-like chemotaxis protein